MTGCYGKIIQSVPMTMTLFNDENGSTHALTKGRLLKDMAERYGKKGIRFINKDGKTETIIDNIDDYTPESLDTAFKVHVTDGGGNWDFV